MPFIADPEPVGKFIPDEETKEKAQPLLAAPPPALTPSDMGRLPTGFSMLPGVSEEQETKMMFPMPSFGRPTVQLPRYTPSPTGTRIPSVIGPVGATVPASTLEVGGGMYNALAGAAESLTTPESALTLGLGGAPKAIGRLAAGIWAAFMAKSLPEQVQQAREAFKEGKPLSEKVEKTLSPILTAALAGTAAKHAIKGTPEPVTVADVEVLPPEPKFGDTAPITEPTPTLKPGDILPGTEAPEPPPKAPEPVPPPENAPTAPQQAPAGVPEQPVKAAEAVPEAQAAPLPDIVQEAIKRGGSTREAEWVWDHATPEQRDAVDAWTVATKHPSAMEPGTKEARFKRVVSENLTTVSQKESTVSPEAPIVSPQAASVSGPAISFPGLGSLREADATPIRLGQIRKSEPELWKAITQMFGTDQPAKIAKAAKARLEQLKRPEGSVGPGAASIEDPAFQPPPGRFDFGEWGRSVIQNVVNAFRPKVRQQLPALPDVSGEFLPDLGSRDANKIIATEPTAAGRVPLLGWLLDPRQRARSPEERAIQTWFHENAMGQAHVQALGSTFGTHFKELFPRNEKGEFTTVGRTSSAQSLHPSDVFEGLQRDPNSYQLSPEQRAAFDELMTYELRARELAKQYKIRYDEQADEYTEGSEGNQAYWTRGRVLKPGAEKRATGGGALGAKQFFQKGRSFETEQEGVEKGFEYPLNVDDRFLMRAGRLYKAIADRRLAKDPGLGGRWGGAPKYEEAAVFQPAFRRSFTVETEEGPQAVTQHKIFPIKTANKLNKAFGPQASIFRRFGVSLNSFLKGLTLGFDWGVGQIQGLPTLFKNPAVWAETQLTSLAAFTRRDVFAQYVKNNIEPIRELAQYGSGVGRLPEMMQGLESGEWLTAAPRGLGRIVQRAGFPRTGKVIGAAAEIPAAFGRQFQTYMDVAKVELWKARREVVPKEEWAREIQAIESQLMTGRMESIGISHGQALAERALLLAPSYYRGGVNLVAGLAEKGASAQTYRRAMGSYIAGTLATFTGLAFAAGLSWDEIRKRLNPAHGEFLMVPVKIGPRKVNIGFGGIIRSFMRLGGDIAETSIDKPGNWKSLAPDKNPITKWLRGHVAPVPSLAWDAFSGKDYMGEPSDIETLSRRTLPLGGQAAFGRERESRTGAQVAVDVGAQLLGLNAFLDKTAKQQIGSVYRDWRSKHPDPKVQEDFKQHQNDVFQGGTYNAIDQALIARDGKALMKATDALLAKGWKLSAIKDRLNPETKGTETEPGHRKNLFHKSTKLEREFRDSLTASQYKLYQQALDEREEQYRFFRRYF